MLELGAVLGRTIQRQTSWWSFGGIPKACFRDPSGAKAGKKIHFERRMAEPHLQTAVNNDHPSIRPSSPWHCSAERTDSPAGSYNAMLCSICWQQLFHAPHLWFLTESVQNSMMLKSRLHSLEQTTCARAMLQLEDGYRASSSAAAQSHGSNFRITWSAWPFPGAARAKSPGLR